MEAIMRHHCTINTDLDELVGRETDGAYRDGPLAAAMRSGEELILEGSAALSGFMLLKLKALVGGIFIPETGECITAAPCFRVVLH